VRQKKTILCTETRHALLKVVLVVEEGALGEKLVVDGWWLLAGWRSVAVQRFAKRCALRARDGEGGFDTACGIRLRHRDIGALAERLSLICECFFFLKI